MSERKTGKPDSTIVVSEDTVEILNPEEYSYDVEEQFSNVPDVAKPLLRGAQTALSKIEKMLYSAPAFINLLKTSVPEQSLQAILTNDQKAKLASGALKLMTKKDGTLMANLVNPKTNKIVSTVALQNVNISPAITQAMSNYAVQMQMAQIAEEIQNVQVAIEEVRQGQEYDRLATAYSCQQKLLQAMEINDPQTKKQFLIEIVSSAEGSRNLLMQSQSSNVLYIKSQPESFWGKIVSGASSEKVSQRMNEIRESLGAVNLVSLVEAMAYQAMGENGATRLSLEYYAAFLKKTYLEEDGLVERLDLIDPSPESYWSNTLPDIQKKIMALPGIKTELLTGGKDDGGKEETLSGVQEATA